MNLKRLALNCLSLSVVRPLSLLINLAAFPLLIESYGKNSFGIYTLAATFASSITAFDFGLQQNIVRVAAEARATGDISEANRVIRFSSKIYWLIGLAFVTASLVAAVWLGWLFKIEPSSQRHFFWAIVHGGIASALIIRLKVEEAILDAHEYHFVRNLMTLVPVVGTLLLLIAVQRHDVSFEVFVSISFSLLVMPGLINWVVRHRLGLLKGSERETAQLPEGFIKNSFDTFIVQALAFFSLTGQQFFVGIVMGPAAVATFASVTRPVFMLRIVTSQTALPLMPQIVSLLKLGKVTEAVAFIRNANALILVILVCVAGPLIACSDNIFHAWLNDDTQQLSYLSTLAVLGLAIAGSTGVTSRYFVFTGEARLLAAIQWRCTIIFVLSAPTSLYFGGLEGFLWVLLANSSLISWLVFREYVRHASVSWRQIYPAKVLLWIIPATALCFGARSAATNIPPAWPWIILALIGLGGLLAASAYLLFRAEISNATRKGLAN